MLAAVLKLRSALHEIGTNGCSWGTIETVDMSQCVTSNYLSWLHCKWACCCVHFIYEDTIKLLNGQIFSIFYCQTGTNNLMSNDQRNLVKSIWMCVTGSICTKYNKKCGHCNLQQPNNYLGLPNSIMSDQSLFVNFFICKYFCQNLTNCRWSEENNW